MSPDDGSFEDMIRSIAREVARSAERMADIDMEEIARTIGVDPTRAMEWLDYAGQWLRAQSPSPAEEPSFETPFPSREDAPSRAEPSEDPLRNAGPHPLDLPTEEQGLALAALDSGRWTVEPGSNALAAHGEGPGPSDSLGLVRELRARDWIAADGEVTLVGRLALSRWLDASVPR